MNIDYRFKDKYNIVDLLEIMQILRAPGGCPWDAEQNHESIKKNFIEETYEVVEAINKNDKALLLEELGDVLLQVVFHAQMEAEEGTFDFSDVCDGICKKLIVRHPHVFGSVEVSNSDEVLTNWDAIKRSTKHQKTTSEAMDSVPRELPALMRAEKLQSKGAKAGAVLGSDGVIYTQGKAADLLNGVTEEKIGKLLFGVVALARAYGIDPEDALSKASDAFMDDFTKAETMGNISDTAFYK